MPADGEFESENDLPSSFQPFPVVHMGTESASAGFDPFKRPTKQSTGPVPGQAPLKSAGKLKSAKAVADFEKTPQREMNALKDERDQELLEAILNNKNVKVDHGADLDLNNINIDNDYIPETKCFRVFRFQNEKTKRRIRVMKCDFADCNMIFRKWHNFFDHLRSHTGERPFKCTHKDCGQSFTQKANLYKHVRVHTRFLKKTIKKEYSPLRVRV